MEPRASLREMRLIDPKNQWPIYPSFQPEGWGYYEDFCGDVLGLGHFPTIDDWRRLFSQRSGLEWLRLDRQDPLSQSQRRRFRKRHGLSPLGFYLRSIVRDHRLMVRENDWHDFFNNLVWLAFPLSKRALHTRAYGLFVERQGGGNRSRVEDGITRFDEGGLVLSSRPVVFGHGLLESTFYQMDQDTSPAEIHLPGVSPLDLDAALAQRLNS